MVMTYEINISPDAVDPPSWKINDENKKKTDEWIAKQLSGLCVCGVFLEHIKGVYPYSEDYFMCPLCESTYVIK